MTADSVVFCGPRIQLTFKYTHVRMFYKSYIIILNLISKLISSCILIYYSEIHICIMLVIDCKSVYIKIYLKFGHSYKNVI